MATRRPHIARRSAAFKVWAAVLAVVYEVVFFGLTALVIGWFELLESVAGPVTDLGYGALIGVILTGSLLAQLRALERRIGMQQAALVIPALLMDRRSRGTPRTWSQH